MSAYSSDGPSCAYDTNASGEIARLRQENEELRRALGVVENLAWGGDASVTGLRKRIVDRCREVLGKCGGRTLLERFGGGS